MTIVYKVAVKVNNKKYISSSVNKFIHNYINPYNDKFGLFGFEHPEDAKLFWNILDIDNPVILAGESNDFTKIIYSIDSVFSIREHRKFWDLYHRLKEPPDPVTMMKNDLYPRELPYGSIVMFDWKFIKEIKNIDFEILDFERRNNANW